MHYFSNIPQTPNKPPNRIMPRASSPKSSAPSHTSQNLEKKHSLELGQNATGLGEFPTTHIVPVQGRGHHHPDEQSRMDNQC